MCVRCAMAVVRSTAAVNSWSSQRRSGFVTAVVFSAEAAVVRLRRLPAHKKYRTFKGPRSNIRRLMVFGSGNGHSFRNLHACNAPGRGLEHLKQISGEGKGKWLADGSPTRWPRVDPNELVFCCPVGLLAHRPPPYNGFERFSQKVLGFPFSLEGVFIGVFLKIVFHREAKIRLEVACECFFCQSNSRALIKAKAPPPNKIALLGH